MRSLLRPTAAPLFVAVLALAACSDRKPPEKPPEPTRPSVIDPQLKAIEAAKGVENTLKEADAERRRMIDGAEKPEKP